MKLVAILKSLPLRKKITYLSPVLLVIVLPLLVFGLSQQQNVSSSADSPQLLEPESFTVSGNSGGVTIQSDSTASDGKYIEFLATTPAPLPTQQPTAIVYPTQIPYTKPTLIPTTKPFPTTVPKPTAYPTPRPPTAAPTPAHPGNGNGHGNGN